MVLGRKYRVGDFWALKYARVLRESEKDVLRNDLYCAKYLRDGSSVPFIKVGSADGTWSIEHCCNTPMYRFLDECVCDGGEELGALIGIWQAVTTVVGDRDYYMALSDATLSALNRMKRIVDARGGASVVDINEVKEGGSHEGQ